MSIQRTLRKWLQCKHKKVVEIGYVICTTLQGDYRAYDGYCVNCNRVVYGSRFSKKWVYPDEDSVIIDVINKRPLSEILRIDWI